MDKDKKTIPPKILTTTTKLQSQHLGGNIILILQEFLNVRWYRRNT